MAKLSAETKAKIREAIRHPVKWYKSNHLPDEEIRPWEYGNRIVGLTLSGLFSGFKDMIGRVYNGMGEGMVPPVWSSISGVINTIWDFANDPLIGNYMDRHRSRIPFKAYLAICRIAAVYEPFIALLSAFRFGMTPLQRVIIWGAIGLFNDLLWTANQVAGQRVGLSVSPHDEQRHKLGTASAIGQQAKEALSAIPTFLLAWQGKMGFSLYQLVVTGCLVSFPLTVLGNWLPTIIRRRVDYTLKVRGELDAGKSDEEAEKPPTFKESFAVVKHNKWFILNSILGFIQIFTPATDQHHFYRFLDPTIKIGKLELRGMGLFSVKLMVVGTPGMFIQPFIPQIINFFGGDLKFLRIRQAEKALVNALIYFIVRNHYHSTPRLLLMYLLEMIDDLFAKVDRVPGDQMNYKALDYVEWKTGHRSEGMTMAVGAIFNKLIKDNTDRLFGGIISQWTGFLGYDFPAEQQPERFMKTVFPFTHLTTFIDTALALIAYCWYKYPVDPDIVERDLIERRALAAKMREEAELARE